MHKRFVNHCTINVTLIPDGPILIKSGKEGADPTKPDMEFVETYHAGGRSIYLPGSSLKGAIRAHAERIVRTVGKDKRDSNNWNLLWANDPLNDKYDYLQNKSPSDIYKLSSFTDKMFGNTSIASRVRIEDAYPDKSQPLKIEERNGVAIDRVFGSVAVGPFNYQVCTAGEFHTKIHLKNFTLAQLGLIGLVLRDLDDGWFGLGFAKSRGLGTVQVKLNKAVVQYPGCILSEDKQQICALGSEKKWSKTFLLGAGEFLELQEAQLYGFPTQDHQDTPVAAQEMDLGFGVQLTWREGTVKDLFERSVKSWSHLLVGAK
ncbi:CRISPR-associated protein [Brasilonema octagenarum UFV-E1]|uniref:CRISPR-associated protein n=2 Tax=Brasilonema TaxID=383614 RepID=A0A856MHV6_9CYAN|nr:MULTISPECIES: RAMP superfamily CRISPR-associated protein [Brasilonema]NMF66453.1 CRISPR-associated protein [Brasilonema octagenarum UFV-OR1]QDL09810.1 CRISPR-associated protein [Brasilonema sennae CENA114]QDL16163.1 CRISPR-associated protein [Brasilonema octagenarum UFV-E1]